MRPQDYPWLSPERVKARRYVLEQRLLLKVPGLDPWLVSRLSLAPLLRLAERHGIPTGAFRV
jgi:hypothetical protein